MVDIGCNDGTLLRSYTIAGIRLVGFEPAENLVELARRGTDLVVNDFFSYRAFRKHFPSKNAKVITSIAMFYDLDDPNAFVKDISKCLRSDGIWIVQQNYLPLMLVQNGFDNIGHEHLTYYSLETMEQLLTRHGLEVFATETNEVNGGSFRTYISFKGSFPIRKSVKEMRFSEASLFSTEPSVYRQFAKNIREIRKSLQALVKQQLSSGRKIYAYGASTRGNTILQYAGLDYRMIERAADANPDKWGLTTPGTKIPIISKEDARRDNPDFFLILPHHFLKEIRRDESRYLRRGGRFIVPLPKVRILSGTNS